MAELASLGIEVSANGTERASRELAELAGAAKRAEAAMNGLASSKQMAAGMVATARAASAQASAALSAAKASDTATQADIKGAQAAKNKAAAALAAAKADQAREAAAFATAKALSDEANAALKAAQASMKMAPANQNIVNAGKAAGTASHNVANLAAQFQDVAVTAAMGMSPLQIALQQGTQLSSVLGPMGAAGAVRGLGAAFLSVISPVSLVVIGFTALAAAGLQTVNWSKLAASGLTLFANNLVAIAPYAALAAAALALVYAPAVLAGLTALSEMILAITARLLGLAIGFAAANPGLAFVVGITAAVAAAVIFRDELTQLLGVDIVGAAKDGVNYIIGSFVAAFEDIKFVWKNLPNIVGAAAVGAANAVINAVNHMINGAKMQINSLIAAINKIPGVNIGAMDTSGSTISNLDNPYAANLAAGVGERNAAVNGALNKDYLGEFGGAITKGASMASAKLKELAKDLTTVDDKSKKKGGGGGGGGKSEAEKYSDIVDGANRRIASLKAEQEALGMTEQAALALKYETDLLNQAQQRGITLTAAQKAELAGLAQTMASTEIATKHAKEAMDFAKESTNSFLSDLRSGLANGEGFFKSFGKAALNVLNKIIDKVQNQLVDALFSVGGTGGGGGLFGSLFGGIGKIFGFASGGYTGNGAANKAAGIVHGGEYVFSAKATKKIGVGNLESMHKAAKGYASGGYVAPVRPAANSNRRQDASNVHVTVGVSADNNGNLMPFVESVSQRNVAQAAPKIVSTANQQVVPTMARYQNDTAGGDYRNG